MMAEAATIDYDEVLEHLGELGSWNFLNQGLIWMPAFISGVMVLVFSFTGLEPDKFRCVIHECDDTNPNPTFDDVYTGIYPLDDGDPDYCQHYPTYANATEETCMYKSSFDFTSRPVTCATKEGNFIYDDFEMDSTIVTEWDLVCDDQFKVALVGSVYMCGVLVGSFFFGFLGDYLGRWWALMVAILVACISGCGGAFVNSYFWYNVTRFFTGAGAMGCILIAFILAVELAGKRTRTIVGINIETPFALGEAVVSVVGIRVKDWRDFHLWTSLPLLASLGIFLIIPESPRWLLKQNRTKEFKKVVKRACKMNKTSVPVEMLDKPGNDTPKSSVKEEKQDVEEQKQKNLGVKALFSTRTMTKITLIMWTNWIVVTIGYYGISLGIGDIGPDVFINFLLISLVEIPSYIFSTLTVDHLGRKTLYVFCIMLTGVGCLSAAWLEDGSAIKTTLCLIGKFGAAAGFAIIYLYTGELHPTEVRSTAVGLCSTLARFGGIAAPQIAQYFPTFTFDAFPMLFMGVCSIVGGALALLLPETLGEPLVESIEELDNIGKDGKTFFSWWSSEKVEEHLQKKLLKMTSENANQLE